MNLSKLFKTQKKLDDRIIKEKGLHGQDLLDEKILALQVELGELANEWRGFKFWSENQESNTEYVCELCEGRKEISALTDTGSVGETYEVYDVYEVDVACPLCEGYDNDENPMLIEYVDCLHFILSIGLEHDFNEMLQPKINPLWLTNTTEQFSVLMRTDWEIYEEGYEGYFHEGLELFFGLGEMLGFTWEQIEQAYYEKNKINHERQVSGY